MVQDIEGRLISVLVLTVLQLCERTKVGDEFFLPFGVDRLQDFTFGWHSRNLVVLVYQIPKVLGVSFKIA